MEKIGQWLFENMETRLLARIESGELTKDENAIHECSLCGARLGVIPARHWGNPVPDYFMTDDHDCERTWLTGASEASKYASFVVLAKGYPIFITDEEKTAYVNAMQGTRAKGVHIRNYFIDGLYTILPFSEWKAAEVRKGNEPPDFVSIP
jgi:hypothetical protein